LVDFDTEKIKWHFTRPGYKNEYFIQIIDSRNQKLMAFFMCHKARMMVEGKEVTVA